MKTNKDKVEPHLIQFTDAKENIKTPLDQLKIDVQKVAGMYYVNTVCSNCFNKGCIGIQKGVSIVTGLKNRSCSYCGCSTLTPSHSFKG